MKVNSIYLIECNGYYKIGKTSCDIGDRLSGLQTGNPFPLTVVANIVRTDSSGLEVYLHNRFKHKRVRGEWFSLSDSDIEYIKNLAASTGYYKEQKSIPITIEDEPTIETYSADNYLIKPSDVLYFLDLPNEIKEVRVDFIKHPEYVNGSLEYVAIADNTTNVVDYLNSTAWTSPRYLFKYKTNALACLSRINE